MQVTIRLSGELANQVGRPRFRESIPSGATVGDLLDQLHREHPQASRLLDTAVPIIGGRHVTHSEPLADGQEVAFLLPIAGG